MTHQAVRQTPETMAQLARGLDYWQARCITGAPANVMALSAWRTMEQAAHAKAFRVTRLPCGNRWYVVRWLDDGSRSEQVLDMDALAPGLEWTEEQVVQAAIVSSYRFKRVE